MCTAVLIPGILSHRRVVCSPLPPPGTWDKRDKNFFDALIFILEKKNVSRYVYGLGLLKKCITNFSLEFVMACFGFSVNRNDA